MVFFVLSLSGCTNPLSGRSVKAGKSEPAEPAEPADRRRTGGDKAGHRDDQAGHRNDQAPWLSLRPCDQAGRRDDQGRAQAGRTGGDEAGPRARQDHSRTGGE